MSGPLTIRDREELKRFRKLCTALDNSTVVFPVSVYAGKHRTVAFMESRPNREISVETKRGRSRLTISDRAGAREAWEKKEADDK